MKKLFLIFILFSTLIISCSSTPTTPEPRSFVNGIWQSDIKVVSNYSITDSMAHNKVKLWISRNFDDGIRELVIDDMINGILFGHSQVTTKLFYTEYTEMIIYAIYIKNGTATLDINDIQVYGKFFADNKETASELNQKVFNNFKGRVINSFQNIFSNT